MMRKNVDDWERVLSVAIGLGLGALAVRRRGRAGSRWLAITGAGLVTRGLSGRCPVNAAVGRRRLLDDTRRALGGARGVRMDGHVMIRRPARELFEFWRDLRNLPKFMPHIERVDVTDDTHSRWIARGPGGTHAAWNAEIINAVPSKVIGWRSLPGSDVASAGAVKFRQISPTETDVDVTMQYALPGGKAGDALVSLTGSSPSSMLRRDLFRLKDLIENSSA